jgi:hypothetical protein
MDPDPGGPKTCGSAAGSGSPTLLNTVVECVVQADGEDWRCSCGTRLTASASINRIRALLKTIIDTAQVD